jgi:hypothetical protein
MQTHQLQIHLTNVSSSAAELVKMLDQPIEFRRPDYAAKLEKLRLRMIEDAQVAGAELAPSEAA